MKRPIKQYVWLLPGLLAVLLLPVPGHAAEIANTNLSYPDSPAAAVAYYPSDPEDTWDDATLTLNVAGSANDTVSASKFSVCTDTGDPYPSVTAALSGDYTLTGSGDTVTLNLRVRKGALAASTPVTCKIYYNNFPISASPGGSDSFVLNKNLHTPRTEKDILSFSINGCAGNITPSNSKISVIVPFGTSLTALRPAFTLSDGASLWAGGAEQVSNTSPVNFTAPVTYTVKAEDGSSHDYVVTVTPGLNTSCQITDFSVPGQDSVTIDQSTGNITIHLPQANTASTITETPVITLSDGATISPGANQRQTFGSTAVDYIVTAQDGVSNKTYHVTLGANASVGSSAAAITSYSLAIDGIHYAGVISESAKTISITLPAGVTNTTGIASFTLSSGASATVEGAAQASGSTSNSFATAKVYSVTAQNNVTVVNYTVTVTPGAAGSSPAPTATSGSATPTPTPEASAVAAGSPIANSEGSISVVATAGTSAANPSLTTTLLFNGDIYNEMKKAVGDAKILTAYDITLVNPGTLKGPFYLTFNVGRANAGRAVTVFHRKSERNYETALATVDGSGRLAIRASSLSPFMILNGYVTVSGAATEINTIPLGATGSSISNNSGTGGGIYVPKTGGWDKTGVGLVFMLIAVLLAILIVLYLWLDNREKAGSK